MKHARNSSLFSQRELQPKEGSDRLHTRARQLERPWPRSSRRLPRFFARLGSIAAGASMTSSPASRRNSEFLGAWRHVDQGCLSMSFPLITFPSGPMWLFRERRRGERGGVSHIRMERHGRRVVLALHLDLELVQSFSRPNQNKCQGLIWFYGSNQFIEK